MPGASTVRLLLVATALFLVALPSAMAQRMGSIKGNSVLMRSGPSGHADPYWELDRGYPLRILKRQGRWLQVRDFENDTGWVARSLVGSTPHHVVRASVANLRKGPGTRYAIVGKAVYGDVLRTRAKRGGWVRVQRPGGQTAWVSKGLLWGW